MTDQTEHSLLSPSGAASWSRCLGKLAACKGIPNRETEAAAKGTVQHWMGYECLTRGFDPGKYLGETLSICGPDRAVLIGKMQDARWAFKVSDEMVANVQFYIDGIKRVPGRKSYERALNTSRLFGIPHQKGTADALILRVEEETIEVHDAKFGYGRVNAKDNEQGILYLGAALDEYDLVADWKNFKFVIHQPAIDHYDEWTYTRSQLEGRVADLVTAGGEAHRLYYHGTREEILKNLTPGEKQCEWCDIRGACEARANRVKDMFETLSGDTKAPGLLSDHDVADSFRKLDEIEGWCKDIRAEGTQRALQGRSLPGIKLVQGKRGARYWKSPEKAEETLSLIMEPEDLYEPAEIISPTAAEKKLKAGYAAIADLVDQKPGSPSVVLDSDPRPAIKVATPEFH